MDKKQLRSKYKALRNGLSEEGLSIKSVAIANRLLSMPIWAKHYYHVFLPIPGKNEVDTEPLMHLLSGKDKQIVVASSDFESREMAHFLLTDETRFVSNSYNIPEPVNGEPIDPEKIDVVFIPLMAFDLLGNRVGYGMGFYDRFLKKCRKDVVKIGLSFFSAEAVIESSDQDIPMDYCVTPDETYKF